VAEGGSLLNRTESPQAVTNRPKLAISYQYPSISILSCVSRCVVRRHDYCTIYCTGPEELLHGKPAEFLGTRISLAELSFAKT
jgi:hypothetical protein